MTGLPALRRSAANNSSMKPELEILGVHPVDSDESIRERVLSGRFPHCTSASDRHTALKQVDAQLNSLVLFEIAIRNRDDSFSGGDFGQLGSEQCAYMERYLNLSGTSVVAKDFNVPPTGSLRLTFFLHFFDPQLPLRTSYGNYPTPELTEMPARLKSLVEYDPVP